MNYPHSCLKVMKGYFTCLLKKMQYARPKKGIKNLSQYWINDRFLRLLQFILEPLNPSLGSSSQFQRQDLRYSSFLVSLIL